MRDPFNSFPPNLFETAKLAQQAFGPFDSVREQMRLWESSPGRQLMEQVRRDDALRLAMFPNRELIDRFRDLSAGLKAQQEFARQRRELFDPAILDRAREAAQLAQALALPTAMDRFRTTSDLFADKLLHLSSFDWARQPAYLSAFNETSALSDMVAQSVRVDLDLREATRAFTAMSIPGFETLAGYRQFLDAAGLGLSRWPQVRLLTAAEKRRRLKMTLKRNAEPPHIKRAKSMVHRYELTLREILDAVMADAYGEDWAEERLPLCDCKDLLGKWRKRGGEVLDHADYAHYERIMSHPEHFEAVFEAGFDDPAALADLMKRAGQLRAASHHGGAFTPEDLRDLRLTWRTIETGLLAFTPDYEVEHWA
jgi:hypothetical protein